MKLSFFGNSNEANWSSLMCLWFDHHVDSRICRHRSCWWDFSHHRFSISWTSFSALLLRVSIVTDILILPQPWYWTYPFISMWFSKHSFVHSVVVINTMPTVFYMWDLPSWFMGEHGFCMTNGSWNIDNICVQWAGNRRWSCSCGFPFMRSHFITPRCLQLRITYCAIIGVVVSPWVYYGHLRSVHAMYGLNLQHYLCWDLRRWFLIMAKLTCFCWYRCYH